MSRIWWHIQPRVGLGVVLAGALIGILAGALAATLTACHRTDGAGIPLAAISRNGLLAGGLDRADFDGRTLTLTGLVDARNLYGDDGVSRDLEDWWSGPGPDAGTWRFDLLAAAGDAAGIAVRVAGDPSSVQDRDRLLAAFVADARAGRPTRVRVTGRLRTFDAPTNLSRRIGLALEAASARAIEIDRAPSSR